MSTQFQRSRWLPHINLLNQWRPSWLKKEIPVEWVPVPTGDTYLETVRLPVVLGEWFTLAGEYFDCASFNDNPVTGPEQLHVENDHLIICGECQWVVEWGISLDRLAEIVIPVESIQADQDDPPVDVWCREPAKSWDPDSRSVSAFFLRFLIREIILASDIGGSAPLKAEQFLDIYQACTDFGFPHSSWPAAPARSLVCQKEGDLLLETHNDDWVFVAAQRASALHAFAQRHHFTYWESYRSG